MITCVVNHVIDPAKTVDFERFATRWIEPVELHVSSEKGSGSMP